MGQKVLLEEEGEEVQEVQNKLERERRTRMALEERVRLLEGQLYQVYSRFRFLDSNHKSIPGSGRKEGRGDPTLQRGRSYGDDGNDGADEHGRTPELRGTDHTDRSCQKAGLHLNLYSVLVFFGVSCVLHRIHQLNCICVLHLYFVFLGTGGTCA